MKGLHVFAELLQLNVLFVGGPFQSVLVSRSSGGLGTREAGKANEYVDVLPVVHMPFREFSDKMLRPLAAK